MILVMLLILDFMLTHFCMICMNITCSFLSRLCRVNYLNNIQDSMRRMILVSLDSLYQISLYYISFLFLTFIITWGINYAINQLYPIYSFWNIWEKIQNFTLKIESESKLIQQEFGEKINFWVLQYRFEKLSLILSRIMSLVMKLKQKELRVNKWKFFDSWKYINSLKTDITNPLESLELFLEEQKSSLLYQI